MSQIILNETASVATPAIGKVAIYTDNTANPTLRMIDDAGNNKSIGNLSNYSITAQSPTAATRTYIVGSNLKVPVNKLQVGSTFNWVINMTKTAAGVAASTFDIAIGANGTTADTARVSFVKPAGTAVADQGTVTINAIVRSIGASGIMVGDFQMTHNLVATGHALNPCINVVTISSGFDMTVANLNIGICITTGAADAITIQLVTATAWNL